MNRIPLPTVADYPLNADDLRTPLNPRQPDAANATRETTPDLNALSEALTPLISAAIARQARQRRYTP